VTLPHVRLSLTAGPLPRLHIPRAQRDLHRGRIAAAHEKALGGNAMDQALAQVGATFGPANDINKLKLDVERIMRKVMRKGFEHPEIKARYRAYADLLRLSLSSAIKLVEAARREERFHLDRARRPQPRLPMMVISELRLILRWTRRYMPAAWDAMRETVAEAAE
jgi:hypothetical protein